MNKKLFLTSAIALGFTCPAIAEPTNTGNFPNDGLMQADYTYTNAATSANMDGVYEGTVNAVAQYTDVLYQIAAGQYLPANSETVINCNVPGSFCPGVSGGVYYDTNNNQGLTSCSSATSGAYTLSDGTGSSAESCYRTCTNNDVAHSTGTVNGGYYYGDNNQCEPTNCIAGWHIKPATPDLNTVIGTGRGESRAWIDDINTFREDSGSYGQSFYGISGANTWGVNYGNNGIIHGLAACSTTPGTAWNGANSTFSTESSITDETGQEGAQYCWCHVDGYTPNSGTLQSLSSSWVFLYDHSIFSNPESSCKSSCSEQCSQYMWDLSTGGRNNLLFRTAMFNSLGTPGPASCEANTITINWNGTTQEAINANNAGTATYGSDVRTPQSASHVPGKTFTGWRFSAPTPVQSGN